MPLRPNGNNGYTIIKTPKLYIATLSQVGTNPPEATVLQNTLGKDITFTRESAGNYTGTCTGKFTDTEENFWCQIGNTYDVNKSAWTNSQGIDSFIFGTDGDGILSKTPIQIKVYV